MALYDIVMDVFVGAQTEILLFLVAVFAHFLVFGRRAVNVKPHVKKLAGLRTPATSSKPSMSAPGALVRPIQALLSESAGQDAIASELARLLERYPREERAELVAAVATALARNTSRALPAACRDVVRQQTLEAVPCLHEALLRGFIVARAWEDFEEYLATVLESPASAPRSIHAIALRGALGAGDLSAALARLPAVAPGWRGPSTPSVARKQLFEQFVRLSFDRQAFPELLTALKECDLIAGWSVQALLHECIGDERRAEFEQVKELAAECRVAFTVGCYAAFVKAAPDAAAAARCVQEAKVQRVSGQEVLVAAAAVAHRFGDAALATLVVEELGATKVVSSELAAAALDLCAAGGPLARDDVDAGILDLFLTHLAEGNFSWEHRSEVIIADAALRKKNSDALKRLLASADSARVVALIKTSSRAGRLQDCVAIFNASPDKGTSLYNALLDACVENSSYSMAEKLMSEAMEAKMADVVTFNTIIKAHVRNGSLRRARESLDVMRQNGLLPNCVTFNELLDAAVAERPESVWGIVKEMQACGCRPNHVTCSIVLKSVSEASRAQEVEKALAVVQAMEEPMDEVLLSSVCEACIRSGRVDLLAQQLERGQTVQIKGAHSYGSLIRAHGALNDIDSVRKAWREMRGRGVVPTSVTLGCMVEALATNGHVDEAHQLIREQLEDPRVKPLVNAVIYCSVLKGFSRRKRFDRVWEVYEELKANKLACTIVTFNTLVDACARSGDMGRISGLLEAMAAQRIEPNVITYSAIVKGYCQENRLDRAFELFADMKKAADFKPDEITYNTLIDGCARLGMFDRGMSVLREMEEAGVSPSNFTLSVLVKLANRSRRVEKAFELVESLSAKYHIRPSMHVYNNLIHACTVHDNYPKALDTAERMFRERVRPDTRTYLLLLQGALDRRRKEDAAGFLRAAAGLPGAHDRLAKAANGTNMRPTGGLTREIVTQALEGIAGPCNDEALAARLLCELRRVPGVSVDPKLPVRLASRAFGAN